MATKNNQSTSEGDYEYRYADWVYYIPAILLTVFGFGGVALLSL